MPHLEAVDHDPFASPPPSLTAEGRPRVVISKPTQEAAKAPWEMDWGKQAAPQAATQETTKEPWEMDWSAFPDTPPKSSWDSFPDKPPAENPADWGALPVDGPQHWGAVPVDGAGITIMPVSGGPTLEPVDHDPFAVDYGGLAKATGVGVAKGAIGISGMAGDVSQALNKGADWVASKLPDMPTTRLGQFLRDETAKMGPGAASGAHGDLPGSYELPTSQDIQGAVEKVTGPFRKPQNQKEEDAQTVGEFLPAAALGPGGLLRKSVTQAAVPAAATITAGRYSDQNPYVKALAGFVAGGAGAMVSGPSSAAQILRDKLPANIAERDVTRAGQLIEHAQTRGVALTWPEALSRVTGQPVLTDLQRILESHGQTRQRMNDFMAGRPAAVENAARDEFSQMGSVHPNPSSLGHEASDVAGETLNGVRQTINRAAEPFYQAAEGILLTPAEMSHVRAIPGWTEARDAVRNNEQLNWRVAHLPDNSVGFLNEVKKQFSQSQENAASSFAQNRNQQVASTHGMAENAVRQIAIAKSEQHAMAHGGPNTYETALGIEQQARERYLNPLLRGPLGKIADQPDTKKAIGALFQTNPLPGSEGEVRNAVFAIARQRPAVAEQLVRAHAEMVFNEAARELQGGASQFAGAKFAKVIAGNSQQRANLQAAIEALPHGNARWQGFEHLLDIMSATGARQPKGSLTAFNELEVQSMTGGGIQELASKGLSPSKWMSFANDTFKGWSLGRNLDQLARIITNPSAGNAISQIIRIPAGSDRALAVAGRLILQLGANTTEQRSNARQ